MEYINDAVAKKNIASIKKSGAAMDKLIHDTGMYAIFHANTHGNTTPLNSLVSALGKSIRAEGFKVWVRDHCRVVIKKDGTFSYSKNRKLYGEGGKEIDVNQALENANKVPFYDYTKESQPVSQVDVLSRIESLIKLVSQGEKKLVAGKHTLGQKEQADLSASLQHIKAVLATE